MKPVDNNGFPGTLGTDGLWDGGDTAAIVGTLIALNDPADWSFQREQIINAHKNPVRHPNRNKWYGQPDRFSRDQLIPILCSFLTKLDVNAELLKYDHAQKDYLTAWNTKGNGQMDMPNKFPDITGPDVWALWIRIYKPWYLRPLLPILDLQTLVDALLWRYYQPLTNRVTRNHMLVCLMGLKHSPTLVMRLVDKINDWKSLCERWTAHCEATNEYQTGDLFEKAISAKNS